MQKGVRTKKSTWEKRGKQICKISKFRKNETKKKKRKQKAKIAMSNKQYKRVKNIKRKQINEAA